MKVGAGDLLGRAGKSKIEDFLKCLTLSSLIFI